MENLTVLLKDSPVKAYNTIDSALALPKGIPAPEQITPTIEVNYDNISETWKHVPKYLREKMELTPEFINSGFSFPPKSRPKKTKRQTPQPKKLKKQTTNQRKKVCRFNINSIGR